MDVTPSKAELWQCLNAFAVMRDDRHRIAWRPPRIVNKAVFHQQLIIVLAPRQRRSHGANETI